MKILAPDEIGIAFAADALRRGGLVGMPTETVYGIAAVAVNRDAVLRTFELKGRPVDNPLIVHIASADQVHLVASSFPAIARFLADAFWPGPLTLVLPKLPVVPDEVTGGLQTVAVRVPSHPVARSLIASVGLPLSAPSANAFMGLSPTRAEHVAPEIMEGLECVLDGGPCEVGLESTVVDCTGDAPIILRPGGITRSQIEITVGKLSDRATSERRSPGTYRRHYSPRTPLRVIERLGDADAGIVLSVDPSCPNQIRLPSDPVGYGSGLYAALYTLDRQSYGEIFVEAPPQTGEWEAVWDRLRKATGV
ncbi:MAG: L-threonylcarbamoyladenylate synthase [Fimbriimonas sp.]|nr:L-threonylcarbamoyladenylate synthase [Fimbriimonas sp.]